MLRVLDLFSGIGTKAKGLSDAGLVIAGLCEIEPHRRAVLTHRFPGVPLHDDVRTYQGGRIDIVAGGPPCKRTSVAAAAWGYRTGETLWPEQLRIGQDVQAKWFVVEQPPGNSEWEAEVAGDLAGAGFHSAKLEFAASDIGAPHRRRRVFIIANRDFERLEVAWSSAAREIDGRTRGAITGNPWSEGVPGTLRVDAGPSGRLDRRWRIEAIGDANPPLMSELIGRAILQAEIRSVASA